VGTESKLTWQALFFYIVSLAFLLQIIAFIAGVDGVVTATCYGTFGTIAGSTATIMALKRNRKKNNSNQ